MSLRRMLVIAAFAAIWTVGATPMVAQAASPPPTVVAAPSLDVTVWGGATDAKGGDFGLSVDHKVIGPLYIEASWDHAFVPGAFPVTQEGVQTFIKTSRIGDRGDLAAKFDIPTGTRWAPYAFGGVGYQEAAKGPSGGEFELGAGTRYRLIGTLALDARWTRYEQFAKSNGENSFKAGFVVGLP